MVHKWQLAITVVLVSAMATTSSAQCAPGQQDTGLIYSNCRPCPVGKFNPHGTAAGCSGIQCLCLWCPTGRYRSTTGGVHNTDCGACPAGKTTESTGADSLSSCTTTAHGTCAPLDPEGGVFGLYAFPGHCASPKVCTDSPRGWKSIATTCGDYEADRLCTIDGAEGAGWTNGRSVAIPGSITDYVSGGKNAAEACCACGGGTWPQAACREGQYARQGSCFNCPSGRHNDAAIIPAGMSSQCIVDETECDIDYYLHKVRRTGRPAQGGECRACPLGRYQGNAHNLDDKSSCICRTADLVLMRSICTTSPTPTNDQGKWVGNYCLDNCLQAQMWCGTNPDIMNYGVSDTELRAVGSATVLCSIAGVTITSPTSAITPTTPPQTSTLDSHGHGHGANGGSASSFSDTIVVFGVFVLAVMWLCLLYNKRGGNKVGATESIVAAAVQSTTRGAFNSNPVAIGGAGVMPGFFSQQQHG
jgi:hypothetical protein